MPNRKPYPSDVSEEGWAFVASCLALVRADASQHTHDLRSPRVALRGAPSMAGDAGDG